MCHLAMINHTEILIVVGVIALLFGARKLPELARSLGSSITQFKKGLKEHEKDPAQITEAQESEKPAEDAR